jgi:hypothetical protein
VAFLKVRTQEGVELINLDQIAYVQYVAAAGQAGAALRLVSTVDVSAGSGQAGSSINYGGQLADGIAAALELQPLQDGGVQAQIVEQLSPQ